MNTNELLDADRTNKPTDEPRREPEMKDLTTAQYLGRFYKELQDEGLTPDEAFTLVRMAGGFLLSDFNDGQLLVRTGESTISNNYVSADASRFEDADGRPVPAPGSIGYITIEVPLDYNLEDARAEFEAAARRKGAKLQGGPEVISDNGERKTARWTMVKL